MLSGSSAAKHALGQPVGQRCILTMCGDGQKMSADLRHRLVAFYQRHNPTNLAQIDAILTAWGHNESELWRW